MIDENDMINADYPIPDPDWDYSEIYHYAQKARKYLQELLKCMEAHDNASPEADTEIKNRLDAIGQVLNTARRMMDM